MEKQELVNVMFLFLSNGNGNTGPAQKQCMPSEHEYLLLDPNYLKLYYVNILSPQKANILVNKLVVNKLIIDTNIPVLVGKSEIICQKNHNMGQDSRPISILQ